MKLYLVECQAIGGGNDKFLLYANTKKEAIDKIWKEHYVELNKVIATNGFDRYFKKDLYAHDVDKSIASSENGIYILW